MEIDFFELEQKIEERYRTDYKTAHDMLEQRYERSLALLEREKEQYKVDFEEYAKSTYGTEYLNHIRMGKDFEKMLKAIEDHPMLKREWEKFLMSMRLCLGE